MVVSRFQVPEIPWELVDECKRKMRKVWDLQDLNLCDPALAIDWARPAGPTQSRASMGGLYKAPIAQMIRDPEVDVCAQLQSVREEIEHLDAGAEIGLGLVNFPSMHMIHFGTGPLATAFGSRMVVREDEQPFFDPAVHSPAEVLGLRKPNLRRDGICPLILARIDYYNEATAGQVPLEVCDTAGPWSIATQIWHYEDMLEAIVTAPEAVHYLLDLVTECMIEWTDIQINRMARWCTSYATLPFPWHPRGFFVGDDTMVAVSPKTWEAFFLPYNNRISRAFGGAIYHCCMRYDFQFPSLIKTEGFMGLDASPSYNDIAKVEAALSKRGVWARRIGDFPTDEHGETGRRDDREIIRQLRGKVGLILGVHGESRQDAIDRAKRLLDWL